MFLGKNEVLNGFILKNLLYYYYFSDPKITREQKLRILCRIYAQIQLVLLEVKVFLFHKYTM